MRSLAVIGLLCIAAVCSAAEEPLYKRIDTPAAPVLTPAQALASFAIAPGFAIELVAAEPLVEDPVAITWDEAGRLYAVEMRGYMPDVYGAGEQEPVGAVVRLLDDDGDGRMDRREVLQDKLVLPRAIAIVNDGLLIAEPPRLWLCPRRAGDVDCGAKTVLGEYGAQPGSVEHKENGLRTGLDNWLYSAKSNRRLRVSNSVLRVEPTLFRGQWGITQDNQGRLFYNTNSNLLTGDYFSAQALVAAGITSAAGLGQRINARDRMFAVRVNTGVNRAYLPGVLRADGRLDRPTSASGMTKYRGHQFPSAHSDDFFVAEPAANAVARLVAREAGLEVRSEQVHYDDAVWRHREFLASTDERFRPVDVSVGPDGALYVVDFYRGIIQDHYFLSDELRAQILERGLEKPLGRGRIWRIVHAASARRSVPDLRDAGVAELVAELGHANAWHREQAQRLLLVRTEEDITERLRARMREPEGLAAVHALWTLHGREELSAASARGAERAARGARTAGSAGRA